MVALEIGTMAGVSSKLLPTAASILADQKTISEELAESRSKIKQANTLIKQHEDLDYAILDPLVQAIERLAKMYVQAEKAQKSYEETDIMFSNVSTFTGIVGIISHVTGNYAQQLDELQKAVNAEMAALRAFRDMPVTAEPVMHNRLDLLKDLESVQDRSADVHKERDAEQEAPQRRAPLPPPDEPAEANPDYGPLPTLLSHTQNVVKTKGGPNSVPKDQRDTLLVKKKGGVNNVIKDESEKQHRICSLWD